MYITINLRKWETQKRFGKGSWERLEGGKGKGRGIILFHLKSFEIYMCIKITMGKKIFTVKVWTNIFIKNLPSGSTLSGRFKLFVSELYLFF